MQQTMNNRQKITIRIAASTLSFSIAEDEGQTVHFEPFVVKSGVSMAANLREAFKTADLLQLPPTRALVAVDSDVLILPVEQFDENTIETLYRHAFPHTEQDTVLYNVLPDLNAVAAFAVNKDLKLVVDDHFRDVRFSVLMAPVWRHLHQRSFTGTRSKLYAYCHEQKLEVFSFHKNRFKFCNTFQTDKTPDMLYFLLYVWNQLQLNPKNDELHIVGDIPDEENLMAELKKFLQNAYLINPAADFNSHPVTEIKHMPYDLMTLYVKGR